MLHKLLSTFFLISAFFGFSQNETDLFRHSKTTYHGSARFEAMGGSFGALGADLSSSQINPAGYGRYSSSHFGASFYGGATKNDAVFNSTNITSVKAQGGLSNMALVLTSDVSSKSKGYIYNQIGIGYNQLDNFRNKVSYEGQQYESLLDNFVGQAQGYLPEELNTYFPFSTDLAYQTQAIQYDNLTQNFYSLLSYGDVHHARTINTRGGINEFFLSLSTNYVNKLYLGANIGMRTYRYIENYDHTETLLDTSGTDLRSFTYSYDLKTKGNGMNLKIGAIYLVNESFRLGLSIHTPTFSEMTDTWSANMVSNFSTHINSINDSLIPTGGYKYKVRTPTRFIGSLAYVFGTKGCINVDLEYLNYKQAHFRSTSDVAYTPYNYESENAYAKSVFQRTLNVRVGAEYVVIPGLFLRGGFSYYGNAFNSLQNAEIKPDIFISGGIGVKVNKFTFDISYRQRSNKTNYYAFSNTSAQISSSTGTVVISGSISF